MSRRERIRGLYLLFALLLLGCGPPKPNAKAVERDLAKEVPLQSTSSQVLAYLIGKNIEHSQYVRDRVQGNSIHAAIRDKSKWDIVQTGCAIVFKFDDRGLLVAYDVHEFYTGP